jgi:hypothetical protein
MFFNSSDGDGDGGKHRSRTVVRFHDDGELLGELEDAAIPSEDETVTLRAMRMMEGPPNPELVDVEATETTWDSKTVTRTVDDVEYEMRWMEYPDDTADSQSSHIALVDVYLKRTDEE